MSMEAVDQHLLAQVSRKRDAILGFVLGTPFESHLARLQELSRQGFDAPPTALGEDRRVVAVKRDLQGFEHAAVVLVYGADSKLVDTRLLLSGGAFVDADGARAAAEAIRDQVLAVMGRPELSLDAIDEWAQQGAYDDTDISCYSAFWVQTPGNGATTTSAPEYSAAHAKARGPVASLNVSSAQGDGQQLVTAVLQVRL